MTSLLGKYAGLLGAPLVWALNTELGQILPYVDCERHMVWTALGAAVAICLALGSALVSCAGLEPAGARVQVFWGRLSVLSGLVFALAIVFQGAASLLIGACER